MSHTEQMFELADVISNAAQAAIHKAQEELRAGKLTGQEFNQAVRQYNETMELATRITTAGIATAAARLEELTNAVEAAKDRIKESIEGIQNAANALKIIGSLLAFAAAIIAALAAPALIPGAVAAGTELAFVMQNVAQKDAD